MLLVPAEVSIFGVYFPPLLLAGALGAFAAALTALLFNRYRLSRYFYFPQIVFLALTVIYTGIIGTLFIPV